jgi:hypothetical protein
MAVFFILHESIFIQPTQPAYEAFDKKTRAKYKHLQGYTKVF